MKHINELERMQRIEARRRIEESRETVEAVYHETRDLTPAETVAGIVARLGYDRAVEAVAEIVNAVSPFDGRISRAARVWAEGVETAAAADELEALHIYGAPMHSTHVDQIADAMMSFDPAQIAQPDAAPEGAVEADEPRTEQTAQEIALQVIEDARAIIDGAKERSAWGRGVKVYAGELLDELMESIERGYFCPDDLQAPAIVAKRLLNGAGSWTEYSEGGCSLIYDSDIAERLCSPSELKKTRGGERRPNSREDWLDVQARALFQASKRTRRAIREAVEPYGAAFEALKESAEAAPSADLDAAPAAA